MLLLQAVKDLMTAFMHETDNGHMLKPKDCKEKISRTWSNKEAKLQKESLQAELQQAQAQLAGIKFTVSPKLAHAYLSKCHKVDCSFWLHWTTYCIKDGAFKHILSWPLCWIAHQLQVVLTFGHP